MKKQILRILSLGLVLSFVLTACAKKPANAIAKVGKEYITAEDVNSFYNDYVAQNAMYMDPAQFDESTDEGKANAAELRTQVLDSIVYEKVAVKVAKDNKIEVTDEELDESLKGFVEQVGGDEAFEQSLKETGLDKKEFEENYKKTMEIRTYITKLTEKLRKDYELSDKELEKELEKEKDKYFPVYSADHILYSFMKEDNTPITDEAEKAKIKAEAQTALDGIKTKEDFQKKFDEINPTKEGEDPAAKPEGPKTGSGTSIVAENLPSFTKDAMVEPFSKAVAEMKKDEVSTALVETEFGYHIIKLNSTADKLEDADEAYAKDVKSKLEGTTVDQKISDHLEEQNEKMGVKFFDKDGKEAKDSAEAIKSFDFSKLEKKDKKEDSKEEKDSKDEKKSKDDKETKESEDTKTTDSTEKTAETEEKK